LPSERQQLLILKFVDQLSNSEIGEVMDRTEGAVKSLYHRTLISLRDDLQMQHMNHKLGEKFDDEESTSNSRKKKG
jgi:DNA-directed RNA polymerase specialized sigma24 family protein